MTDEVVQELQKQLHLRNQAIDNLNAELAANKEMFGNSLNNEFQCRTQIKLFQKQLQDLSNKNGELEKTINGLNQQLTDATARLVELDKPEEDNVKQIANGKKGK